MHLSETFQKVGDDAILEQNKLCHRRAGLAMYNPSRSPTDEADSACSITSLAITALSVLLEEHSQTINMNL